MRQRETYPAPVPRPRRLDVLVALLLFRERERDDAGELSDASGVTPSSNKKAIKSLLVTTGCSSCQSFLAF